MLPLIEEVVDTGLAQSGRQLLIRCLGEVALGRGALVQLLQNLSCDRTTIMFHIFFYSARGGDGVAFSFATGLSLLHTHAAYLLCRCFA